MARRGSGTRIQGAATPSGAGRSLTTATAPRSRASPAWARPSNFAPRIATKTSPGRTRRESLSTRATAGSSDPRSGRLARCDGHLGARQGRGELHEIHGAEGGGAVSSMRRAGTAGAAPVSARNRVWIAPAWMGVPGGRILGDHEAGALDPSENSQAGEEGQGLARGEAGALGVCSGASARCGPSRRARARRRRRNAAARSAARPRRERWPGRADPPAPRAGSRAPGRPRVGTAEPRRRRRSTGPADPP